VTFVHPESGETRRTQMFYAGDSTWKFRFTGTRVGEWEFTTQSDDPDLDGLNGQVTIDPNPDPDARGFLTSVGNKYAMQVGNDGRLEGYLLNVYMNEREPYWYTEIWRYGDDPTLIDQLMAEAQGYGFNTVFISVVANSWFELGTQRHDEHNSEDPDLETFEIIERQILATYNNGMTLHLWGWGDEERRWTPIGVPGGINGEADRRLQRYIAARLGPLPGWSMGYGFDLAEWVTEEQVNSWAEFMQEHMGWEHLLFGRGYGYDAPSLSGISYSSTGNPGDGMIQTSAGGPEDYNEVVSHLESDPTRPHFYEERFAHERVIYGGPAWTMERTRRGLWQFAMAGGIGSFWGFNPNSPFPYPNPEQLQTFSAFWEGRFLLDMERANDITDGYGLRTSGNDNYVFYGEEVSSIDMNLSAMADSYQAVAVDTLREYEEIDLGVIAPSEWTWHAPYDSDWAIAVGAFAPERPSSSTQ
jgi:hypothetical protein